MKNEKGFTLMELLIVIAIIGILATIAIGSYVGTMKKAARSEAYSNLQNLRLLEEQFYAENGRYTAGLGISGVTPNNTFAIRDANVNAIRTTVGEALPGFQPGSDSNFVYWTVSNFTLPPPPLGVPFDPTTVVAATPCFVSFASGIASTRVDGDVFAIDCNNNRNF